MRHLQLGDVADGVVLAGALALDGRVEVRVCVDVGAVRGGAGAGIAAAAEPRWPHAEPAKHPFQRIRCK